MGLNVIDSLTYESTHLERPEPSPYKKILKKNHALHNRRGSIIFFPRHSRISKIELKFCYIVIVNTTGAERTSYKQAFKYLVSINSC